MCGLHAPTLPHLEPVEEMSNLFLIGPGSLYQCSAPGKLCWLFGVVTRNETYISFLT